MQRILITSLSVHWTIVFALAAFQAGGMQAEAPATAALLAIAHALVAILFLWLGTVAWGRKPGETDTVARLAFAVAALVLAAGALVDGLSGQPLPLAMTATQLAVLGVTYLVVGAEDASAGRQAGTEELSGAFARRLALAAAHGSMLTRLSRRSARTDTDA